MAATYTNPDPEIVAERDARVAQLHLRGFSDTQIAQEIGITTRTVQRSKRRQGIRDREAPRLFTPEEDAIARQLLADGASYGEVGRTLGRHSSSISERYRGQSSCTPADGIRYREMLKMLEEL
jgi:DNA-binding NarL/FixJ family response regulator